MAKNAEPVELVDGKVVKEKGYLYFFEKDGTPMRTKMARGQSLTPEQIKAREEAKLKKTLAFKKRLVGNKSKKIADLKASIANAEKSIAGKKALISGLEADMGNLNSEIESLNKSEA